MALPHISPSKTQHTWHCRLKLCDLERARILGLNLALQRGLMYPQVGFLPSCKGGLWYLCSVFLERVFQGLASVTQLAKCLSSMQETLNPMPRTI